MTHPPAPVGPPHSGRRIASRAIDFAVWTAAFTLAVTIVANAVAESLTTLSGGEIIRVVLSLLATGGDVGEAAESLGEAAWRMVVVKVELTIFILIGFHLAYELAANLWHGRTVGRMLLDLRVTARTRRGVGLVRALARAVVTVACTGGLYGLAWIPLLHGEFIAAFALWLLAVAILIAYFVLSLIGKERRSLGDLLAGTRVVHAGVYAKAGQAVVHAAQAGTSVAQSAAQAGASAAKNAAQAGASAARNAASRFR